MTEFNKVFCMAPWVHMNVNCNGDVYPCCMLPILETEEHEDTDKMLDYEEQLDARHKPCNFVTMLLGPYQPPVHEV